MNNVVKISVILTLVMMVSTGCTQKSTTKKKTDTTNELKPGTGTGTGTGSDNDNDVTSINGCDGIVRNNASRCYYKNIPRITLNGAGNTNQPGASVEIIGPVLWSSLNNLPGYDQGSFSTDLTFNMRIKAIKPYQNEKTLGGRYCSNNLSQFTRVKVHFMLRNSVTSITNHFSIEAKLDQYSKKFIVANEATIPSGAPDKILEVVGIMTDHRCQLQNPPIGCGDGSYWGDIPAVIRKDSNGNLINDPVACASFQIEYATDTTYDLPN